METWGTASTSVKWMGDKRSSLFWTDTGSRLAYLYQHQLVTAPGQSAVVRASLWSAPDIRKLDIFISPWGFPVSETYPACGCGIFRVTHRSSLLLSETFWGLEPRWKSLLCPASLALPAPQTCTSILIASKLTKGQSFCRWEWRAEVVNSWEWSVSSFLLPVLRICLPTATPDLPMWHQYVSRSTLEVLLVKIVCVPIKYGVPHDSWKIVKYGVPHDSYLSAGLKIFLSLWTGFYFSRILNSSLLKSVISLKLFFK